MNREFLNADSFNKKTIMENVFKTNDFDGLKAHEDLSRLVREEKLRNVARFEAVLGAGGALISLYNLSRIGQLSSSGKVAAVGGLALSSYWTLANINRSRLFRSARVAEEKKVEQ